MPGTGSVRNHGCSSEVSDIDPSRYSPDSSASVNQWTERGHAPVTFTEQLTAGAPRPGEVERLDLGSSVGATVIGPGPPLPRGR